MVDLIASFLKTPIFDKRGHNYTFKEKGIPQGSAISPVLMNCFLHHLDIELEKYMVQEDGTQVFFYERYADDIIFGIPKGDGSREEVQLFSFKKCFFQALRDLKLSSTFVGIVRERSTKFGQRQLQVLGLIFSLRKSSRKAPRIRGEEKGRR